MSPRRALPAWAALEADALRLASTSILALFEDDPERLDVLSASAAGLELDLSKSLVDRTTLSHLLKLAEETDVAGFLARMLAGEIVNTSEGRAALHAAQRAEPTDLRGTELASFVEATRADPTVNHVLVIGIGGSHLGPALVTAALRREVDGPELRFVTSVDPASFDTAIAGLRPSSTVVIASSKSFTTLETATNLARARTWLGPDSTDRIAVVTSRPERALAHGLDATRIFAIDDGVGGRYSVSSAIGLPVMLAVGIEAFIELLEGFAAMDAHVATVPYARNLPVLLGLLRIWYSCFLGAETAAVVPYATDLALLPAFLQQLEMESLGKGVDAAGRALVTTSGPILWGGVGTDAQHAFFQLLHQGTHLVPVDLIGVLSPMGDDPVAHELLISNLLAQAEVLAAGLAADDPSRSLPGNRPSTLLLLDHLDPRTLGALIALYEHATAVQGALLGLNPFDQWGVEAGKLAATQIAGELDGSVEPIAHDPSTAAALERYRSARRS